jgi:hypothetical protein
MFVDLLVRYVCKDLSARSLRSLWRGFLTSVRIRKSFNQYVPKTQIIYYIHLHSCRHRRGGDFTSPNFGLRSGYMKYIRLSLCTYIYTIMLMNILCLLWFKMVLVARVFWPFLLGLGYDQCFILADASSGVDRADEQTVAMAGGPKGTQGDPSALRGGIFQ